MATRARDLGLVLEDNRTLQVGYVHTRSIWCNMKIVKPVRIQRSGAVGACRAHNPEAVGSKPTFAMCSTYFFLHSFTLPYREVKYDENMIKRKQIYARVPKMTKINK